MKKLNIIGWIASVISFIGIILNAYQLILCWPIWCVANIIWMYWSYKKREWAQLTLWIVFTFGNFYGWYQWSII